MGSPARQLARRQARAARRQHPRPVEVHDPGATQAIDEPDADKILPDGIDGITTQPIGPIPNPRALVARLLDEGMPVDGPHGLGHAGRIAAWGRRLHPEADRHVVLLFCLLHDSQRQNDVEDTGHGLRAAELARTLNTEGLITLDRERLELLAQACAGHTDGVLSDDPTVGACWDSDRLDLVRVGIQPAAKFMSTQTAKELIKEQAGAPVSVIVEFALQEVLNLFATQQDDRPVTVYHGTAASREADIRKNGLQLRKNPRARLDFDARGGPFVTRSYLIATQYAFFAAVFENKGDGGVVFEFRLREDEIAWFFTREIPDKPRMLDGEEGLLINGECSPDSIVCVVRQDPVEQLCRWTGLKV